VRQNLLHNGNLGGKTFPKWTFEESHKKTIKETIVVSVNPKPYFLSTTFSKEFFRLETKPERKAILKAKRKEKVDKARAEGAFDITYSQRRKRLKQSTMESSSCKINVVLDMQFSEKVVKSLG